MAVRELIPRGRSSVPMRRGGEVHPLLAFQREMNRLFEDFIRELDAPFSVSGRSADWPRIDAAETEKEYRVTAELPGLDEKDIDLTLSNGVLTLKGEKKVDRDGALYAERFHGAFQRSVELSSDIDQDKVTAAFKNGVLTVSLPKRAEAALKTKRISVNSG